MCGLNILEVMIIHFKSVRCTPVIEYILILRVLNDKLCRVL